MPAILSVLSVDGYLKLFTFCILSTKPQRVLQSLNLLHIFSLFSTEGQAQALGTLGNSSDSVLYSQFFFFFFFNLKYTEAGLKPTILLPPPLSSWGYRNHFS